MARMSDGMYKLSYLICVLVREGIEGRTCTGLD